MRSKNYHNPAGTFIIIVLCIIAISCQSGSSGKKNQTKITVSKDFEQGNIGNVTINGDTIRADMGPGSDAIWFAFRIDGAEGKTVKIVINNILWDSRNNKTFGHFRDSLNCAAITYDSLFSSWELTKPGSVNADLKQITFTHTITKTPAWVFYSYTVTNNMLKRWIDDLPSGNYIENEILCTTTGLINGGPNGHCTPLPLHLLTITDTVFPEKDKKVFWIITREDPWETSGTIAVQGAVEFLLGNDPVALAARKKAIWKIIPLANVDGVSSGFGGHPKNINGGPSVYLTNTWGSTDDRFTEVVAIEDKIKKWVSSGKRFDAGQRIHSYGYMVNNSHVTIEYNSDTLAKRWSDMIVRSGSQSVPYKGNPSPNRWTSWVRNTCNLPDVPLLSAEIGLVKDSTGVIHTVPEIKKIGEALVRGYCEYFKFTIDNQ